MLLISKGARCPWRSCRACHRFAFPPESSHSPATAGYKTNGVGSCSPERRITARGERIFEGWALLHVAGSELMSDFLFLLLCHMAFLKSRRCGGGGSSSYIYIWKLWVSLSWLAEHEETCHSHEDVQGSLLQVACPSSLPVLFIILFNRILHPKVDCLQKVLVQWLSSISKGISDTCNFGLS